MATYAELTGKMYGELVKMKNGDYHVLIKVDGVGSGNYIHIHTREGKALWVQRDQNGKLYEA